MKALRRLMLNMKWRKFSSQMIMTGRRETLKMRMMLEQRIRNLLMSVKHSALKRQINEFIKMKQNKISISKQRKQTNKET